MTNQPITDLALALLDFLACDSDDMLDDICASLTDDIIPSLPNIDQSTARAIMRAAHAIDPAFAFHAAHLRDAIRDNSDLDLIS